MGAGQKITAAQGVKVAADGLWRHTKAQRKVLDVHVATRPGKGQDGVLAIVQHRHVGQPRYEIPTCTMSTRAHPINGNVSEHYSWALFLDECAEFNITPVQYAAMVAIEERAGVDAAMSFDGTM